MIESTDRWPVPSAEDDRETEQRQVRERSFWRAFAYFTSLGWFMALPIAVCVLLGHTLDRHFGTGHDWTLTLLGVGIGIACLEGYLAARAALHKVERRD